MNDDRPNFAWAIFDVVVVARFTFAKHEHDEFAVSVSDVLVVPRDGGSRKEFEEVPEKWEEGSENVGTREQPSHCGVRVSSSGIDVAAAPGPFKSSHERSGQETRKSWQNFHENSHAAMPLSRLGMRFHNNFEFFKTKNQRIASERDGKAKGETRRHVFHIFEGRNKNRCKGH